MTTYSSLATRLVIMAILFVSLCVSAHAEERRFIWETKEKNKLDSIEKKIEKAGKDDKEFYTYETDNWTIKCQISARFAAEAGYYMDMFYELLDETFDFDTGVEKTKGTFYIYNTKDQFASKVHSSDATSSFSWSSSDGKFTKFEMYTYMDPKNGRAQMNFEYCRFPSIRVEATRAYLLSKIGPKDIPRWMICGISKFYGYWDVRDTFKTTSKSKAKTARKQRMASYPLIDQIKDYVKDNGDLPRIQDMIDMSDSDWEKENYRNWVICSSIFDCLFSSKSGCELVQEMLMRVSKDEDPVITPKEFYDLEGDWYDFLRDEWHVNTTPDTRAYLKKRDKPE